MTYPASEFCENARTAAVCKGWLSSLNKLANVIDSSRLQRCTYSLHLISCALRVIDTLSLIYPLEFILNEKLFDFLEQSFILALMENQESVATRILAYLTRRIGAKARRIEVLDTMLVEWNSDCSPGSISSLIETYQSIMASSPRFTPVDLFAAKRIAALHMEVGDDAAAVESLNLVLKYSSSDTDSWLALSEIYTNSHEFEKAVFCIDELILLDPLNNLLFCLKGELLYAMRGKEARKRAIYSFKKAYELDPEKTCLRALLGGFIAYSADKQLKLVQDAHVEMLRIFSTERSQNTSTKALMEYINYI